MWNVLFRDNLHTKMMEYIIAFCMFLVGQQMGIVYKVAVGHECKTCALNNF